MKCVPWFPFATCLLAVLCGSPGVAQESDGNSSKSVSEILGSLVREAEEYQKELVEKTDSLDEKLAEIWEKRVRPGDEKRFRLASHPELKTKRANLPTIGFSYRQDRLTFDEQAIGSNPKPPYLIIEGSGELYPNGNLRSGTAAVKGGFAMMLGPSLEFVASIIPEKYAVRGQNPANYVSLRYAEMESSLPVVEIKWSPTVMAEWSKGLWNGRGKIKQLPMKTADEFASEEEAHAVFNANTRIRQAHFMSRHFFWQKAAKIRLLDVPLEVSGQYNRRNSSFVFVSPELTRVTDEAQFGRAAYCFQIATAKDIAGGDKYSAGAQPDPNGSDSCRFYMVRKYEDVEIAKKARSQQHSMDVELVMSPEGSFVVVGFEVTIDGESVFSKSAFEQASAGKD